MKTALVIEDNVDNMELMRQLLEANGYKVLKAETGQQGFDVALEARPDFILLDIQLPDIDGLEVLQKIRSSEIKDDIPVIAVTSYAMAGDREKIMAAGCNSYIEKPIDPEKVISRIRQILGENS
jgi:CheY-like chemotaxis protein